MPAHAQNAPLDTEQPGVMESVSGPTISVWPRAVLPRKSFPSVAVAGRTPITALLQVTR